MRAFVGNSSWLLFDRLIRIILGVLVGAWVARYLGPGQYGQLSYALAFVAVFTAVANLGADGITVRDISVDPSLASEILGTAAFVRALAGALCLIIAIVTAVLTSGDDHSQGVLVALAGTTLVLQAIDVVDLWFQSNSQSKRTVTSKLVAYLITSGIKVILILRHASLIAFACVLVIDYIAAALALLVAYRTFPASRKWRVSRERAYKLLRDCRSFAIGGLMVVLYMRVDQIMIRHILGERALGLYAASVWLLQLWQIIPATLSTSLGPYIARRKALNEVVYKRTLVLVFRTFFFAGVAGAVLTYVLAPLFIRIAYGHGYLDAIPLIRLYAWTLPFYFLSLAHNLWLINEGRYSIRVYGAIVATGLTIAIIDLLSPRMGVISACVAAIVSQSVAYLLLNALLDRQAFRMQVKAIFLR